MVIMAQMGCYVPARSATFKIFDKLFVRMNNDDSIAEHESSFVREMRDDAEDGRLQRYRATCGEQPESLYGIRLADRMGFPQEVIEIARQVAGEIGVKSKAKCEALDTMSSLEPTVPH
ncbi:hypothetical protein FBU59_004367 [Linderina macrospora]|uniref:Uncharacterized protein n=1 Tax=Linderina macrospora TaxID=4868 RepID=A0ACC1J5R9_9FUNG|nr:hypothetical protein FBU59_004367 [Linderina macrospora]